MSAILLCFDGSAHSRHAIEAAGRVLRSREAVVLVAISSLAEEVFGGRLEDLPELPEARTLAEEGAELARAAGFSATAAVEASPASAGDQIVAFAVEHDVDVIVVGARGLSNVKAAVLGSVSQTVVRHAHRPVLVVHDGA